MNWAVSVLSETVEREIEALPKDRQAKLLRIITMIWRDGISRAIYVTAWSKRVVIVRAFVKKPQKTPRAEIELALKRAEELT